jgi:recombinational DNA repair protein (RecF pathway)|tara:strand:+ start:670 stop:1302 length:633 start_codon:yes stop_codon:yes gene_type:complete
LNKTQAILTNIENFKDNHLLISVYSILYGRKSLVVFGGKSKKKNSSYIKGLVSEIEFNQENTCLNSNIIQSYNWFLFDKYRLKTVDYICFLIGKLLFLEDERSNILKYYINLISKMNLSESYISEFLLLELEILKTSGYQPDLNENILAKIFKEIDFQNLTTNEEIITKINSDFEAQSQFFDFMGRVVSRVLINLNINLPFSRSEIIQKN